MILSSEQEDLLDAVTRASERYEKAKGEELAKAVALAHEKVLAFKIERDKACALAHRRGVPKSQIGQVGLGVKFRGKAIEAIENGEKFLDDEPVDTAEVAPAETSKVERFSFEEDGWLLITLTPADFEPYKDALPAVPTVDEAWAFEKTEGGSLTPRYENDDETWLNPVVRVVMNTMMQHEALDWLNKK